MQGEPNEIEAEIDLPLEAETAAEPVDQGEMPAAEPDEVEDEVIVSIGDEAPPEEEVPASAPAWVKQLRREFKQTQRENRELRQKLAQTTRTGEATQTAPSVLPPKPTLEGSDYDAERFENSLAAWYEKKREHEAYEAQRQASQREAQDSWTEKLNAYQQSRATVKAADYEEAEAVIAEVMTVTQQGMILSGAEKPALLIYALGKNPKKAAELAAIKDPVQFAFAVARLETTLKVQNRKPSAAPERSPSGTAPKSGNADTTLERLRAEAERTGDLSKVIAYKRQIKARRA